MTTTTLEPASIQLVADEFRAVLARWLSAETLAEIDARNKAENNSTVCHSHDFCDSNMAMQAALERFNLATSFDVASDEHARTWGEIWKRALADGFSAPIRRIVEGSRVALVKLVDVFPTGIWNSGTTGTVARIGEDGDYWIKLDEHYADLDEWNNELQIWDYSIQDGPDGHPLSYLRLMD